MNIYESFHLFEYNILFHNLLNMDLILSLAILKEEESVNLLFVVM